jgi:hypothetical protein
LLVLTKPIFYFGLTFAPHFEYQLTGLPSPAAYPIRNFLPKIISAFATQRNTRWPLKFE